MNIPSLRPKSRTRIEIIPLIDIVFFLLATFVMVSLSMVKNQGIAVNLPKAAFGAAQERKDSVTVTVAEKGDLFFDKTPVSSAELETALRELKARDADPRVFIQGDAKAEFGKAVAVLDAIRRLGIAKVSIQTQPASAPDKKP